MYHLPRSFFLEDFATLSFWSIYSVFMEYLRVVPPQVIYNSFYICHRLASMSSISGRGNHATGLRKRQREVLGVTGWSSVFMDGWKTLRSQMLEEIVVIIFVSAVVLGLICFMKKGTLLVAWDLFLIIRTFYYNRCH